MPFHRLPSAFRREMGSPKQIQKICGEQEGVTSIIHSGPYCSAASEGADWHSHANKISAVVRM